MKLYALLDFETLKEKQWSIEQFISTCKNLHVEIIQYRDKKGDTQRRIKNLKKIKSLCDTTLLVNDDVEAALFCDGLHVGQEDLVKLAFSKSEAISKIRQKIGGKIIGISTHNEVEILEANDLDIAYIGLGAYRVTSTKEDTTVLGESLGKLARLSLKPVAAIGGVKIEDEIENVTYAVIGRALYEH